MSTVEKNENVRAVGRALEILAAFTEEDPQLSAGELLKRVDLSRPTLYRLIYTLQEHGFLVSVGEPQRFRLGPAVSRLAHVWKATLDLSSLADPVLRKIWEETRETVALLVPQGQMRLCIAELPSPQPLNFKRGVGSTERLVLGATGRAILAWMDPTPEQLRDYAQGTQLDLKDLEAELGATRKRGYSVSRNELVSGAVAVAVPFFDGFDGASTSFITNNLSVWRRDVPSTYAATNQGAPIGAYAGPTCAGTLFSRALPGGVNAAMLISPAIDLSGVANPVLDAKVYYDLAAGLDGALVAVSADGTNWTVVEPVQGYPVQTVQTLNGNDGYSGRSYDWEDCWVDLSPIAGARNARIAFAVYTDAASGSSAGLFVDEVRVAPAASLPAPVMRPSTSGNGGTSGGTTSGGVTSGSSGGGASRASSGGGAGCAIEAGEAPRSARGAALIPWAALLALLATARAARRGA